LQPGEKKQVTACWEKNTNAKKKRGNTTQKRCCIESQRQRAVLKRETRSKIRGDSERKPGKTQINRETGTPPRTFKWGGKGPKREESKRLLLGKE